MKTNPIREAVSRMEYAFVTFINAVSVRENFFCFHNVTIGANRHSRDIPKIGNNVTVCTGAAILGGGKYWK